MELPGKKSDGAELSLGPNVVRPSPRVIALFADDAEASLCAIRHVRKGAQSTPVWLYSMVPLPSGVTASFSPTFIAAPGSGSSTLTFSASSTAAATDFFTLRSGR